MRIGFDIDGVLASFIPAYQRLVVEMTGRDLFKPGDDEDPPCWDWPQYRGYSSLEITKVWDHITTDPYFWKRLTPTMAGLGCAKKIKTLTNGPHRVMFITNRVGVDPLKQTMDWLRYWFDIEYPTVFVTPHKGDTAKWLGLDMYVEDNLDNANDVAVKLPSCKVYLIDRQYNQGTVNSSVQRITSLDTFLDDIVLRLRNTSSQDTM